MQTKTCDTCGTTVTDDFYRGGWGHFHGTDALGQHRTRDFCPRCSAVIQLAIDELEKKLRLPASQVVTTEGSEKRSDAVGALRKLLK